MAGSRKRVVGYLTGVIYLLFLMSTHPLFGQPENPAAKAKSIAMSKKRPMDGPPSGMSMHQMMRGPQTTELYPTMISNLNPTAEERARMEHGAKLWVSEGTTMLTEGAAVLTQATRRNDVADMGLAGTQIKQGLSRLQSGLSIRQALGSGKPPAEIALRWFKSQLNLDVAQVETRQIRILGMMPFQLFICLLMLASIGIAMVIYFHRMRRAYRLLERINGGRIMEANLPQQDIDLNPARITEEQKGLLPIQRKKLCRLRLTRVYPETPDVKTFRFVSCDGSPIPFSYLPGQFLTLTLPIEDKLVKRSYTISSSPTQGYYCEISVKREQYGVGSRYLHDVLQEGNTVEVRGPSGRLTFTGKEADSIVLIGGGVGITPLMSVTRALADMSWKGEIILVVSCSDPDHFIFSAEIERIKERNTNLRVYVSMSSLQEDHPDYYPGRISRQRLLDWIPDIASRDRIHLCASPNLLDALKLILADLGVPSDYIRTESFGSQEKPLARQDALSASAVDDRAVTTVEFMQSVKTASIEGDETVLEAAERIGVDMNYSCRVGSCGECCVKVVSGEVVMDVEDALEPEDKAANIILACQARPVSNIVIEA